MKLLCDEMLKGLARWLRAAGYDVEVAPDGSNDRDLVARARSQGRLFVTRDRRLVETLPEPHGILLLDCSGGEDCLEEAGRKLGIDWLHAPFSRCLGCNTPLQQAAAGRWQEIPPQSRAGANELRWCPTCDQLFWDGSHVARMRQRLEGLAKDRERRA